MDENHVKGRLPGLIGLVLVVVTTSLWVFWGVMEMFYEGWWGDILHRFFYLALGLACMLLTVIVLTWPRFGGWLIIALGGAFTAWWWSMMAHRVGLSVGGLLSMFPVSGMLLITGVLFLFESRYRQKLRESGWQPPQKWLQRNLRYVLGLGIPLLVGIGVAVYWTPILLARVDDGDRGARRIDGNGVTLVWAPEGPGWAHGSVKAGENLSWNDIALYGVPPVGFGKKPGYTNRNATAADMDSTCLCRYLSADGLTLMDTPQNIWRMPTVDEIVRSLVHHGENAGCEWDGTSERANCDQRPDKETPLWAPNWSPIYYWAADEYDSSEAYYVSFNGRISQQPKTWGNPRHGFRCVRDSRPEELDTAQASHSNRIKNSPLH